MKKRMISALLLCGVCLLGACGEKETTSSSSYTKQTVQALARAGVFSEELEEMETDMAYQLYRFEEYEGMERDALTDSMVTRSAGGTCEMGAVLIWETEEQAEQAKEVLMDYVEEQIIANEDYRPNEIPKLEQALVEQRENTVLLVIANDMEAAKDMVK